MTIAYEEAKSIIKQHVNAGKNDALIIDGTGVTGIINKFQRILGLRLPESCKHIIMDSFSKDGLDRPVVFVSHMEHHRFVIIFDDVVSVVIFFTCIILLTSVCCGIMRHILS